MTSDWSARSTASTVAGSGALRIGVRPPDVTLEVAERAAERREAAGELVLSEVVLVAAQLVGDGERIADLEVESGAVHATRELQTEGRSVDLETAARAARTRVASLVAARARATRETFSRERASP